MRRNGKALSFCALGLSSLMIGGFGCVGEDITSDPTDSPPARPGSPNPDIINIPSPIDDDPEVRGQPAGTRWTDDGDSVNAAPPLGPSGWNDESATDTNEPALGATGWTADANTIDEPQPIDTNRPGPSTNWQNAPESTTVRPGPSTTWQNAPETDGVNRPGPSTNWANAPYAIAVGPTGSYLSVPEEGRVYHMLDDSTGQSEVIWDNLDNPPLAIAVGDNAVYFSTADGCIHRTDLDGNYVATAACTDGTPTTLAVGDGEVWWSLAEGGVYKLAR